ncbi:hypothetical protein L3V83_07515 [Thiotrichales bacterium 19X7-9]|nr:hypothetical protein [Thiotrichales bacterium 19X7-9]
MKTKVQKKYIYHGLLFPIELSEVVLVYYDKQWQPKIDVLKLSDQVIKKLAFSENRLTGNQLKFIRNYFNMSLRDFARDVVSESHNAVAKWEKYENEPTNMDLNIEKSIRLYICDKVINIKSGNFQKNYRKIESIAKKNHCDKSFQSLEKEMLVV